MTTRSIAAGFARYGLKREAMRAMTGIFDASLFFDLHRLPELFCGFATTGRRKSHAVSRVVFAAGLGVGRGAAPASVVPESQGTGHRITPHIRKTHPAALSSGGLDPGIAESGSAVVDVTIERHGDDTAINVPRKEGDVRSSRSSDTTAADAPGVPDARQKHR